MREAGTIRDRNGRYSQQMRDDDMQAIRDLYRANGFKDVNVEAGTVDDFGGVKDSIAVRFQIREGALVS